MAADIAGLVLLVALWAALKISSRPYPTPLGSTDASPLLGRTDPEPVRRAMEKHRLCNPTCVSCKRTPVDIHHIIPVAVDPAMAGDPANLMSLCPACHIAYGHAGDPACRRYVPNIQNVLRTRVVLEI